MIQSLDTRSTTSPGGDDLPLIGGHSRGVDQEALDAEFIKLIQSGRARPIGSWIWYVRNSAYDYDIVEDEYGVQTRQYVPKDGIVPIDVIGDTCESGKILAIGPGCEFISDEDIGGTIKTPEIHPDQHRIQGEVWAIRESLMLDTQGCIVDGGGGEEI